MSEKSNSFVSSLKSIAVLLVICIVCGALLALCNDIFYIDDETKFNRAMQKVYPEFQRDSNVSETPLADFKTVAGVGNVSKVYASKDGTYILETTGLGGFSGGNVTMYVAIGGQNPDVTIKALLITGNVGQSWVAKVDQKSLDKAYVGKNIKDLAGAQFGADYKLGGTTGTSTAILNAVKTAISYCVDGLKLVSTPESEARDAAVALLAGYTLTTVVDEAYTTELGASFYFTGTKDGADDIDVYVFGDSASGHQIVAVKAGLKHADRLAETAVVAKSEGIDNALVQKVQGLSQLEAQIRKSAPNFTYDEDGDLSEFTTNPAYANTQVTKVYKSNDGSLAIVAESTVGDYEGYTPGKLTMMVVVAENKIAGWSVVSLGDHSFFQGMIASKYPNAYVGESITAEIAKVPVAGATGSADAFCNIINIAAYYARSILQ